MKKYKHQQIALILTISISFMILQLNAQELKWNNGFLDKEYKGNIDTIRFTMDSILGHCLAVSRQKIENGVIYESRCGTISGINLKNEGTTIYYKWIPVKKDGKISGVIVGFKFEDNDKNQPIALHNLLKSKLKKVKK